MNDCEFPIDEEKIVAWRDLVARAVENRSKFKECAEDVAQELAMKMVKRMRKGCTVEDHKAISPTHWKEVLRLAKGFSNPLGIEEPASIRDPIAGVDADSESFDLDKRLNRWFSSDQTSKMVDLVRGGEFRQEKLAEACGIPARTFRHKLKEYRKHTGIGGGVG